jgi:hypothetical protein
VRLEKIRVPLEEIKRARTTLSQEVEESFASPWRTFACFTSASWTVLSKRAATGRRRVRG